MTEPRPVDIVVAALSRALLDGVDDGTGGERRRVDLAVLPCFEDERPLQGLAGLVDWRTSGSLSALVRQGLCTGAAGEAVLLPGRRTLPMERLVLLGLGPARAFDRAAAEAMGERLVTLVERLRPRDVLVAMPGRAPERTVVESVFDGLTRALARRRPEPPDAQAQRAAKAVGDESTGPVLVEARPGPASSDPSLDPSRVGAGPRPMLAPTGSADEPTSPAEATAEAMTPERSSAGGLSSAAELPASGGPPRGSGPPKTSDRGVCRWWVVADPRHEARLRRLLEGPPRAAEPGA